MTDVLIYWRDYRNNWLREVTGGRAYYLHSNAKLVAELLPGDRLWLVTSGKNVGHEAKQAGFLMGVWQVQQVIPNPGDDPAYRRDEYRYRILANELESLHFDEPVPVDHILRPPGQDRAVSIGRFLQGPRKLKDQTVRLLRAAAGPQMALKWLTGKTS